MRCEAGLVTRFISKLRGSKMAYGEHTTAYQLLAANATQSQIEAKGQYKRDDELGTVTFPDGSRIALRKFGNHQAYLASGWNITPTNR